MKRKKKKEQALQEALKLFPVILAIAIIPLLVRFTLYDPALSEYAWFKDTTGEGDFFMICKQSAVYILDALIVCAIAQLALQKNLPWHKAFIPLIIYGVFVIFSTFVSVSPYHSLNGFYNMMESTGVLLGYCGICYYTYAVVKSEQHLKTVLFGLFISIIIICAIGMSQMFGSDFLLSDIGKLLVFPSEYASYGDSIQQNFAGTVSSTLFNPNYVGVYTCMIIPILLTLMFTVKKQIHVLLYLILTGLAFTIMIGAGSKTAFITLIPCLLFLIIYIGRHLKAKIIPIAGVVILIIAGVTIYQGEDSLLATTLNRLTANSTIAHEYKLEDITLNDDNYVIRWQGKDLSISYTHENGVYDILAKDEEGNTIPVLYSDETERYRLDDDFYQGLYFRPLILNNTQIGYTIHSQKFTYSICYSPTDATYYYLNEYGKYMKLYRGEMVDIPLFRIMGGFSGRDYIWQYSVPLLKRTVFLGSGPDTFSFLFPQYDYVSKIQDKRTSLLITKPHNTYLQIGVQTGVLSLIAYLGFYILYFIDSAKLYFKRHYNSFAERCGAGIFIGSICYMFAGLLHDSTIGVSIVFWTLLGLGYCCNRLVKESDGVAVDGITWMPKLKPMQTVLICLVASIIIFTGHFLCNANSTTPADGQNKFSTNALNTDVSQNISFQTSAPTKWTFDNGQSASGNAYVENPESNSHAFYFEVILSTGECVYTSSTIEVGQKVNNITLKQALEAGSYPATIVYHLLNADGSEIGTAPSNIQINILH